MLDELGINGFVMEQDKRYLKLGTDAMLLSEFAGVKARDTVCDLGCGTGAVSILLAARHEHITVHVKVTFSNFAHRLNITTLDGINNTKVVSMNGFHRFWEHIVH